MGAARLLITGATGFVGSALTAELLARDYAVVAGVRSRSPALSSNVQQHVIGNISSDTDWGPALAGVNAVVHLAARVHVLRETAKSPLNEFRAVNVHATLNLARQAANNGVNRFVFVSSIGVNGAETFDSPFSELSAPAPHSDYARSKLEAEEALQSLCTKCEMELVIIRPPLIYHWNAPGNFQRLLGLVRRGIALPFARVDNHRSMICLPNLVDFIALCVSSPAAADEIFIAADGTDISTPRLLHLLSEGMNKNVTLVRFPLALLQLGATLTGKRKLYQQLCGSLQLDITKARSLLGWVPPVSTAEGLRAAGRDFVRATNI